MREGQGVVLMCTPPAHSPGRRFSPPSQVWLSGLVTDALFKLPFRRDIRGGNGGRDEGYSTKVLWHTVQYFAMKANCTVNHTLYQKQCHCYSIQLVQYMVN